MYLQHWAIFGRQKREELQSLFTPSVSLEGPHLDPVSYNEHTGLDTSSNGTQLLDPLSQSAIWDGAGLNT